MRGAGVDAFNGIDAVWSELSGSGDVRGRGGGAVVRGADRVLFAFEEGDAGQPD